MKPRLKTSGKWTEFPKEYIKQIQEVFSEAFADRLQNAKLIVEGRIYSKEVLLRVGFLEKGRLAQPNFECSVDYSPEKQDAVDRIYNCIDATASMMQDYFDSDGEVEFPYTWQPTDFQGQKVYLQYSTENSELEAEANKILGVADDSLVKEHEDEPEIEEVQDSVEKDPDDDGTRH
ncbi:MAG: hypothetical protein AB7O96_11045 [Pseudobdellovibrionaceae bacterium]